MNNNSKEPLAPLLPGTLGTLILLAVILAYTYTHKPFSPDELLSLLVMAWRVIVVAAIISLGGGIGVLLLKQTGTRPAVSRAVIQAALGLGLLGTLTLIVGSTAGLSIWLWAAILLAGIVLLRKQIKSWWQAWSGLRPVWLESSGLEKAIAVFVFFLLAINFFIALAPPFSFDALTYHFSIPKTYLLDGRISYLPANMYSGMPELVEMLYTLAMRFGGAEAAALLGWGMGLLALVGILDFVRTRFSLKAAWIAVACLLAGETLTSSLAWGYVEWPVILYGTAILILLSTWKNLPTENPSRSSLLRGEKPNFTSGEHRTTRTQTLLLAGVMAGMALAIKYTNGILMIAGALVILGEARSRRLKGLLADWAIFGGMVLLVMSPWLVKNLVTTGNPVYPFLFPSGAMDAIRLDFYQHNPIYGNWLEMLLLPWQATVWGVESKAGYSASIGPLLLGLSLLAWIGWRKRPDEQKRTASTALIIVVTCFVIWAVASRMASQLIQTRLYVSMLPAWALLAGMGYEAIAKQETRGIRFERLAGALALLALSFNAYQGGTAFLRRNSLDAALGIMGPSEYLAISLGDTAAAMETINDLPDSSKVLMLWETMDYYCLPNCDGDEIIDRWHHDRRLYGSAEAIRTSWQEQGYTHLLVNDWGLDFVQGEDNPHYTAEDWEMLERLLASLPAPTEIGEDYRLFEIK